MEFYKPISQLLGSLGDKKFSRNEDLPDTTNLISFENDLPDTTDLISFENNITDTADLISFKNDIIEELMSESTSKIKISHPTDFISPG